ncbi:hypothetical protein FIBSPDRAFT_225319 [Athelia psychrophila]|uniref:Uncharacterized protein n=1 Tax=Athelia psychrophila TaxID=1759441 RepID=A0A166S7N2_9AGAM|nr:hypothetical protein FIBSPDRAFT_225319 [Fibularhizoctonia sp. CBS 109695]
MSQPPSPTHRESGPSHHAQDKETNHHPRRGRSLSLSSDEPRRGSRSRGRAAHHPPLESDVEDRARALQKRPREARRVWESQSEERGRERQVAEKKDKRKDKKAISLRLDMDLDIEVEIKAKIKGRITLSLLDGSE